MAAVMAAEYVYQERVHWGRILDELNAQGFSDYKVALILGADSSTVGAWHKGSEPRYGYGAALLNLHAKVCPTR
jgi:hypothetical protein